MPSRFHARRSEVTFVPKQCSTDFSESGSTVTQKTAFSSHPIARRCETFSNFGNTFGESPKGDGHVCTNSRTSVGPWPASARSGCYLAGRDHHASVSNDQSKTLLLGPRTGT